MTLTNYALYFESLGVGLYDKAVRYDLATDMKQVIKPELTGPLGARLFDKAVMYKSTSTYVTCYTTDISELSAYFYCLIFICFYFIFTFLSSFCYLGCRADPVYLEFPEFKGNSRRDYWLDISLEILYVHRFIRRNNLKGTQKLEVLARVVLGIFRYRAVREAFRFNASHYKTLLPFNLAESLPRGDFILETLSSRLILLNADATKGDVSGSPYTKRQSKLSPVSLRALSQLGFVLEKEASFDEEAIIVGDVCVGETNPLELAVKQSLSDTSSAEAAQATVDQVKVEGIDTNVAVMKVNHKHNMLTSSLALLIVFDSFLSQSNSYPPFFPIGFMLFSLFKARCWFFFFFFSLCFVWPVAYSISNIDDIWTVKPNKSIE